MNLYLRLLLTWLRSFGQDRLHYEQVAERHFRVLPHDLDAFGHMNNGRYLQIMDVARIEWMLATGVAGVIRSNRWSPLLGGSVIRYRYSLRLFQGYRVRTRLFGWDDRWFYLEHVFVDRGDRRVAVGVTRAGLYGGSGWVHASEVAEQVHPGAVSPAIPPHVHDWIRVEETMFDFEPDRDASRAMVESGSGC